MSRCFVERSDASDGARVIERSLRRYLTVSRMRQPDGPAEDGGCLLLSRLCFLLCSTLPHASKLLHSAIDTDWRGAVNTSSVANCFLDLVQAARPNSSIDERRHGADARRFLLVGGPWQAGEARSPSASLPRDNPPVRGSVSPNLAVDPASVNSRGGDDALKSRRGSTSSLSSRPAAARDSSEGDALVRLGARLKRLQPALEARQRDTGKASLVNSDERRERGTSRGASAPAAAAAVRESGDVTRRRPSPGPAEPRRDGRSGRGMSCQEQAGVLSGRWHDDDEDDGPASGRDPRRSPHDQDTRGEAAASARESARAGNRYPVPQPVLLASTSRRNKGSTPTVSFPAPLGSGIEVVVDCAVTEMNARRQTKKQLVAAVNESPARHTGSTNSRKSLSSGTSGSATSKSSACPSSGSSGSSATPSSSPASGAFSASSSAASRSGSESMLPREPYGLTHSSDGRESRVASNSSKDASPSSSSSSRSETESVLLSKRQDNTAVSAGRHPDARKVVGNEMVAKEARPPKNSQFIVAARVVPVNGLPLHGVPYLIRQQTRTLETDGVVILRVSRDLRPSSCALPAKGKVSVWRQKFPSYPTIVSTDMSDPDISGRATAKLGHLLPSSTVKQMTLKEAAVATRLSSRALQAAFPGFNEQLFVANINEAGLFWEKVAVSGKHSADGSVTGREPCLQYTRKPAVDAIDLFYPSDVLPSPSDGLSRSPGDPMFAWQAPRPVPSSRLASPKNPEPLWYGAGLHDVRGH